MEGLWFRNEANPLFYTVWFWPCCERTSSIAHHPLIRKSLKGHRPNDRSLTTKQKGSNLLDPSFVSETCFHLIWARAFHFSSDRHLWYPRRPIQPRTRSWSISSPVLLLVASWIAAKSGTIIFWSLPAKPLPQTYFPFDGSAKSNGWLTKVAELSLLQVSCTHIVVTTALLCYILISLLQVNY